MNKKYKIFYDVVHGNVKIPVEYCQKIIDTVYFQRLRRIEQTSMRSLFPCAHHDRFVHSIGTFYLGQKIFDHVIANSAEAIAGATKDMLERLRKSYELACLLHDCGHAPFSHTFEKFYDMPANLNSRLMDAAGCPEFVKDFNKSPLAKEHERLSAFLLLRMFRDVIEPEGDSLLAARMIIGCRFQNPQGIVEKLGNCFISLLNGHIIDADRLDYVCRDQWASGYSGASVNIERLLSAMAIRKSDDDTFYICFYKSAISEIHNLLNNKDFQYSSVISHHKVVYDQYVLERAVSELMKILKSEVDLYNADLEVDAEKLIVEGLFNVDSFFNPVKVGVRSSVFLPTDDDVVHLLKEYMKDNPFAEEWLSRQHRLRPLWKSLAEFQHYFRALASKDLEKKGALRKCVESVLREDMGLMEGDFEIRDAKQSVSRIKKDELYVWINDSKISYDELRLPTSPKGDAPYLFYVYVPAERLKDKEQFVNSLIVGTKREKKTQPVVS